MFTFLFDEYKAQAVKEYRRRLLALYAAFAFILALAGCALMLPGFLLVSAKKTALTEPRAVESSSASKSETLEKEVAAIQAQISTLKASGEKLFVVNAVAKLAELLGDISVHSISVHRKDFGGAMTINGISPTRDTLVAFSKRLEGEKAFANVNLPVSSLARAKDIPFSLVIDFYIEQ